MKRTFTFVLCLFYAASYCQIQLTSYNSPLNKNQAAPGIFFKVNNKLLFLATSPATGQELWSSDGTPEGTMLVKDIRLGKNGSSFSAHTIYKDKAYFLADDGINGMQLWVTDGTAAGTVRITSVLNNPRGKLVNTGAFIFFFNENENKTFALWKSDGTAAGTVLVKDNFESGYNPPINMTTVDGLVFFSAAVLNSSGSKVWRSDGTTTGTFAVTGELDGNGSALGGTQHPSQFIAYKNALYFIARGAMFYPSDVGLMKSDGTFSGTVPIRTVQDDGQIADFGDVIIHNDKMYFSFFESTQNRLFIWESQGTEQTTTPIFDETSAGYFTPSTLKALNNDLYFTSGNSNNGTSLVKYNLTNYTSEKLKELAGPRNRPPGFTGGSSNNRLEIVESGKIFIQSSVVEPGLFDLWTSDGSTGGTFKLDNIKYVSAYSTFAIFNNKVFFNGTNDNDFELWTSDGTNTNTVLFKDIAPHSIGLSTTTPSQIKVFKSKGFFVGRDEMGLELWQTDGTQSGTTLFKDIYPGSPSSQISEFIEINDKLLFLASTSASKRELYASDGTAQGTLPVTDIFSLGRVHTLIKHNSSTAFMIVYNWDGLESLYITDGTTNGTREVMKFMITRDDMLLSSRITYWASSNSMLYFTLLGDGEDLWKSDGTTQGTLKVKDFDAAHDLVAVNSAAFFTADDSNGNEEELYMSDGTADGTHIVKNINDTKSSYPKALIAFNNKLIFSANESAEGTELWTTDGTEANTIVLKNIFPGISDGIITTELVSTTNQFFFVANDEAHGVELWKSDGTSQGTVIVKDIVPGKESSGPEQLKVIDDNVYFSGYTPQQGYEIWRTDGTIDNTKLVLNLLPGPEYSSPFSFTDGPGDNILFFAFTPTIGVQLWSYDGIYTTVENNVEPLAVYPNPSNGLFHISSAPDNNMSITVYNAEGITVYTTDKVTEDQTINLGNFPSGLYFLQLIVRDKKYIRKLIKY